MGLSPLPAGRPSGRDGRRRRLRPVFWPVFRPILRPVLRLGLAAPLLAACAGLWACGGGGGAAGGAPAAAPFHGIAFSPYEDGQDPNLRSLVSREQIERRMAIVAPYTTWIRTFGMDDGLEASGAVARTLGLKTALGAWIGPVAEENERQIGNLLAAVKAGEADMVIVGSEVLLRGDLPVDELIAYLQRVRAGAGGVPVGYADVWDVWLGHPELVAAVDVVVANCHPFWSGVDAGRAVPLVEDWYHQVQAVAADRPVIIGETGWPTGGDPVGEAVPALDDAVEFLSAFLAWAEAAGVEYFYFEAFDEPWKEAWEGSQGPHWGVWDQDGVLKEGMATAF